MSEKIEIENFEDLMNVFENTGDFGEYYLGDYSNIQIANYLRNLQQENKQLKEDKNKLRDYIVDQLKEYEKGIKDYKRYGIEDYTKGMAVGFKKCLEILEAKENEI